MERLQRMKEFFHSGETREYAFRFQQLKKLKNYILSHEAEIQAALYTDLKKNPEESWVSEIGFLLSEINYALKHLRKWMKRKKVATNFLNFPSKSYIYKDPLGVVLIIGTWNYPLQLLLTPMVGAIAAGNCIVLKPSEHASSTADAIFKMVSDLYAEDYIQCIQGDGATVIPPLINGFRFDHIFYTGSTQVGKSIYEMAAKHLVPVTLELGGKSPCIIEPDADLKIAARRIAVIKFSNVGQMCVAPDYILVHNSVKDAFIAELINAIRQFYSDDPKTNYNYGKIINDRQYQRLKNYLSSGNIIYGGKFKDEECYIEPTVIVDAVEHDALMNEEIFGPILPLVSFSDFKDALGTIEKHSHPLSLYLFTNKSENEKKWMEQIQFGSGCINNASWQLTNFNLPFGGIGNSGIGRYHGKYTFDTFTHEKAVMRTPLWFDPKLKYPPFKGKLKFFKMLVR